MDQINPPYPTQAILAPKSKPTLRIILMLILGLLFLGLAGVTGWWIGQKQLPLPINKAGTEENIIAACVNKLQADCREQINYQRHIVKPAIKWPGLITSSNLNYQLGGVLQAKEKGQKNGKPITIYKIAAHQNPAVTISVYTYDGVNYKVFEGKDLSAPDNLKPSGLGKFNIGDAVYIDASTPPLDNTKALENYISSDNLDLEGRFFFKFIK